MNSAPMVRVELEQMRVQLLHYMQSHNDAMGQAIERAVNAAFDNFDFEREIEAHTEQLIRQEIHKQLSVRVRNHISEQLDLYRTTIERVAHDALARRMRDDE
jgi:hypothetical protein